MFPLLALVMVACTPSYSLHGYHKQHALKLFACHQVLQEKDTCEVAISFSPDLASLQETIITSDAEYDLFRNHATLWQDLVANTEKFVIGIHNERQQLERFLLASIGFEAQLNVLFLQHSSSIQEDPKQYQALIMAYNSYVSLIFRGYLHLADDKTYQKTLETLKPHIMDMKKRLESNYVTLSALASTSELEALYLNESAQTQSFAAFFFRS